MVSEEKLYRMREKAREDKQQARFDSDGTLQLSHIQKLERETFLDVNEEVLCPFCLHGAKLRSYLTSTAKGISHSRAICPECKNEMLMHSLLDIVTPKQYAEWVYNYRKFGFWKKCPFLVWKERLHRIGWSYDFWERYRELKEESGEYDEEQWH